MLRVTLFLFLSTLGNVSAIGMLYPRFSETRTILSLDGVWNFIADTSPSRNKGFDEKWYTKPLSQV